MSKLSFKLFGDRVLVEKVNPKPGTIYIPPSKNEISWIGRVVACGDGKRPALKTISHSGHYYEVKPKDVEMVVKPGDLVYFQTNAIVQANQAFAISKDSVYLNIAQAEIIAKVKSNDIKLNEFEMLCDWVLVKPFSRHDESTIVLPDTVKREFEVYFRVEKTGTGLTKPIKKGDEVVLSHGFSNPLQIEGETYAYIHQNEIHGIVEETP